jgi:hypothetical protein
MWNDKARWSIRVGCTLYNNLGLLSRIQERNANSHEVKLDVLIYFLKGPRQDKKALRGQQ